MERAFDATKYGRWSEHPILEATIPSLADPIAGRRAQPGTHVMSVIAQYAPYELREGDWDSQREAFGDAVIGVLESVAPGIGKLVTPRQVLTPVDLERDYGLTGGHPLHAEAGLDQFFVWRPLLGHARYRTGAGAAVPVRLRRPSRWRHHRRPGPERGARDRLRPQEAAIAFDQLSWRLTESLAPARPNSSGGAAGSVAGPALGSEAADGSGIGR